MNRVMRSIRRNRRGLAEIVGTLMLVVIVVAAATAFSFFVAAYQKQLQTEEALNHDKSLENIRVFNLVPTTTAQSQNLTNLRVELASLDVNPITIVGITINGYAVANYTVTTTSGSAESPTECLNGNPFATSNVSCVLDVPAESQVPLSFNITFGSDPYAFGGEHVILSEGGLLSFDVFTSLGNEFTQSFVPPVAIAGITFVDSYPILDGGNSYQPATNSTPTVTLDQWNWSVTAPSPADPNALPASVTGAQSSEVTLLFWVPVGYSASSAQLISGCALTGTGFATPGTATSLGNEHLIGATQTYSVTFDLGYDVKRTGSLFLTGCALYDNESTPPLPADGIPSNASNDTGTFFGQEVELPNPFTQGVPYFVALTVVDSEYLSDSTTIHYELL